MTWQSTQELIPQVMFGFFEPFEEDTELSHAAIFEVKIGKMSERAITDSRERTAGILFFDVGTVALNYPLQITNRPHHPFVKAHTCLFLFWPELRVVCLSACTILRFNPSPPTTASSEPSRKYYDSLAVAKHLWDKA